MDKQAGLARRPAGQFVAELSGEPRAQDQHDDDPMQRHRDRAITLR